MAEINGWMSLPDPLANALFAGAGWDSVTLDAQHGLFDDRAIATALQVLAGRAPKRYVRPPANDLALVGRALDAGADGVIVPLVNSAQDARRLAAAAWYPPKGARSFGPILAALRAEGSVEEAAARIEVFAMIETREALEAVQEIAVVDGVTGLYVGPNDLALSLGFKAGSDREEPELNAAFRRVLEACSKSGKRAGIYCASPAYAVRMAELGFDLVTAAGDAGLLGRAAAAAVAAARVPPAAA